MTKIDLKITYKHLYSPSPKEIVRVDVPEFRFLMIDGEGDPNTSLAYAQAIEALYAVSYTVKFMVKKTGTDYAVMPLEGLWWSDDPAVFAANDKAKWKWTMMVLQPDFVPTAKIEEAIAEVKRKKALSAVDRLRVETFAEGHCAQILFIGPFQDEGPTIQRVHDFIQTNSSLRGKHHEIYLTDIRRADPLKWRTIIRQPMA